MSPEEIECGFRNLGLADENKRLALQKLTNLEPKKPEVVYEIVTARHTAVETIGGVDAKLE